MTPRNRFEYRYYVLQFSQSGRFPDWCGYGPSEDLKNCTTDDGSNQGAIDSGSDSEESDAETKLEPGPGEATGAGEGAGVGSNQGMKPVPPANADKGASTGPGTSIWASLWENRSSGFPTRSDTNRAVQSQKMARGLKFCI